MSLISSDTKYDLVRGINNLISLKHLHNSGADAKDLSLEGDIFVEILQRLFQVVEVEERKTEDVEKEVGYHEYTVYGFTVVDERFIELSKKAENYFLELSEILDQLPTLDIYWDGYRGEFVPIESYQWLINQENHIYGLTFEFTESTPIYYPEVKVFSELYKKIKEVLSYGYHH